MLHVSQFLTDSLLNEQLTERYVQDASGHRSPDPFFNSWRLKWLVHTRIYRPSHHLRHYFPGILHLGIPHQAHSRTSSTINMAIS